MAHVTPKDSDLRTVPQRLTPGNVLITGATSGLGKEFARQLAAQGYRLVITGRSIDRLAEIAEELENNFDTPVETLSADLTTRDGLHNVIDRLRAERFPITFLINNAGCGVSGDFDNSSIEDEVNMLQLNVQVPMMLTHAVLPLLLARGGRVLNVASVTGLVPDGSYGASKAYMVNFSRWANAHYKHRGVHVTALCPGPMNTEFYQRAGIDPTTRPKWMFTKVEQVALEGLAAVQEGRSIHIPGRAPRSILRASKFTTDSMVEKLLRSSKN